MKRICVALAVLAVAAIIITGCGGGGGGGTPVDPGTTTTLSGRVLNSDGITPINGAQVTVSTGTDRATLTDITDSDGLYSISNVPVGTLFDLRVSGSGGSDTLLVGLTISTDAGSSANMNVVVGGQLIPSGCTVHIEPDPIAVYAGETSYGEIRVRDQFGEEIFPTEADGWKASVVVTGAATLQLPVSESPNVFGVRGGTAGQTAKITVLAVMASGAATGVTQTVTIRDMDTPPGPPL